MSHRGSLSASLVASTALHVLALGLLVAALGSSGSKPMLVVPVSLVGLPGSGGGDGGGQGVATPTEPAPPPAAPAPAVAPSPPRVVKPSRPRPVARPSASETAPAPTAALSPGEDAGGTGSDAGGGTGSGAGNGTGSGTGDGGGGSLAGRIVFGPPPRYPDVALRQRKQGVVLLEVVIAPDGRAQDVRVVGSSGFAPLDASAVTTVRERFRFAPERRGDAAVESSGTLVIRFTLRGDGQG